MGMIRVDIGAVVSQSNETANAQKNVANVKATVDSASRQLDPKVLGRNNIGNRLNQVSRQLSDIQSQVGRIQWTVENGANSYYSTEMEATRRAKAFLQK